MEQPRPCLDALFPDAGGSAFLRDFFPERTHVAHGSMDRLGDLSHAALDEVDALVARAPDDNIVGYKRDASGAPHQEFLSRAHAVEMYERGTTLEINLSSFDPVIQAFCDRLAIELGLPPGAVFADAFASPEGEAVPKHFDSIEVIVVQLRGHKRWRLAENPDVRYPAFAFIPGFGTDLRALGAARIARDAFSTEMPGDSTIVDMRPGSALFVPRGHWHRTEAVTASLSLSFVIKTPTALSLASALQTTRLTEIAEWRRPLSLDSAARTSEARAHVARLLDATKRELASSDLASLVPRDHRVRRYRRAAGVVVEVVAPADGHGFVVKWTAPDRGARDVGIPDFIAPLLEWIARTTSSFTVAEMSSKLPGAGETFELVLGLLVENGIVESA